MTDPTERDPTLPTVADETDAEVPSDEDFEPLETDEDRPESDYVAIAAEYTAQRDYGAIGRASDAEETTALGDSAINTGRGARGRAGVRSAFTSGSSPSEVAVHVGDSTSTAFVVVVVLAFVAIFAYGLLGGVGGFLTPIPTAAPAPIVSLPPSAAPSPSLAPSAAPSASGIASPSAGPSGGSPAASTSPVASPSPAAPSPSPSPAASPSG